jgi:hypothetical protein
MVGLAIAAPLCAWIGSKIGEWLAPIMADFNEWLEDGVLSHIPGFSETKELGEDAVKAVVDAAKAAYGEVASWF